QGDAADLGPPNADGDGCAGEVGEDGREVEGREWHAVGIDVDVTLLLPAVGVELLPEVAVAVEQPDTEERDAEATGRLEVVAREDAQPARILGQGLGDPELRREVGDTPERRPLAPLEPARRGEVPAQAVVDLPQEAH